MTGSPYVKIELKSVMAPESLCRQLEAGWGGGGGVGGVSDKQTILRLIQIALVQR